MPFEKGKLVLMGSGELTATMVEVHKGLLADPGGSPRAVFLDSPAGFQLNADHISRRAAEYFRSRVRHDLSIVSFKSRARATPLEAEKAFHGLREADYILIGPGSPTYALRQWRETPIADIFAETVRKGGCLTAASAAALTVGRFTLPVYEIYKVGEDPRWVPGLDVLSALGLDLAVVPHWNNAEGGNHDTRFCFMGEARFRDLLSQLPEDVSVLGLDEHTACLMDFARDTLEVRGLGRVVLKGAHGELVLEKGREHSLDVLRNGAPKPAGNPRPGPSPAAEAKDAEPQPEDAFWTAVHALEASFHQGLEGGDVPRAVNALLELDRTLWEAHRELESEESVVQARDVFRELTVLLGTAVADSSREASGDFARLVDDLVALRQRFRAEKQWGAADALRDALQRFRVSIEDTREGPRWSLSA